MPLYQQGPSGPVHIRDSVVLRTTPAPGSVWKTAYANAASADAFFRQRVASPYTLFDSKQIFDDSDLANSVENSPLFWDNQQTSGGGTTTTYTPANASTTLAVSATTAGVRVRQTRRRFNYQPGKSQVIILTGVLGSATSGVTKEYGYFDDSNGVFFRLDGSGPSVVVRKAGADTAIAQAAWNVDPMDGTGSSGVSIDFTKTQILVIDFEWLGVGTVRYGFFVNGTPYYCHYANHANLETSVYMSTPNLPVRARIANDGTGAADSVEAICVSVISEGGVEPTGVTRAASIGATAGAAIQAATINTSYAICGIRLKSNYLGARIDLTGFSVLETGNNNYLYRLHWNPTLTTGLSWADLSRSAIQFGTGSPSGDALTDQGIVIGSGYVARDARALNADITSLLTLGSLIDGTRDIIVLSGTPLSVNQDFYGSLAWIENL